MAYVLYCLRIIHIVSLPPLSLFLAWLGVFQDVLCSNETTSSASHQNNAKRALLSVGFFSAHLEMSAYKCAEMK